jgi:UDP-N-acetylglucosamine:LPS N-acetylglucosamine transferase
MQLTSLSLNVLLVKGKPEEGGVIIHKDSLGEVGHLNGEELQTVIEASEFVICRSGYSSIMDLATLQKKNVIMVPTPGQPEQEYLADFLESKGLVYTISQEKLNVAKAMKKSIDYLGFASIAFNSDLLNASIDEALLTIKSK